MAEKYHVIGLMSGTSLDGLDLALVEFTVEDGRWQYEIIRAESIPYDNYWHLKLSGAIKLAQPLLAQLHMEYGHWLGQNVQQFIRTNNLRVDLVASHGHTVFHEPARGITLQIGDGQAIADITGLPTICDFRSGDVALGGQGAPLVPIGDKLLFSEYAACLNLGGIANISFEVSGQRIAFDIGMANLPLNYFARELALPFDKGGAIARRGKVNKDMLDSLDSLEFYNRKPPKSLGIEWFLSEMLPIIDSFTISTEDKLATLVQHEARQIAWAISSAKLAGNILVTGGGAFNGFFIEQIEFHLTDKVKLILPPAQLIEYKEALIFALMGVLRYRNEINCLKSVTGARQDSSAGEILYPGSN